MSQNVDFTTYRTSEQVVGTWYNGKPIYRRVFSGTYSGSAGTRALVNLDTSGIFDDICQTGGCVQCNTGSIQKIPLGQSLFAGNSTTPLGASYVDINPSKQLVLAIYNVAAASNLAYSVFVEYTKTTD